MSPTRSFMEVYYDVTKLAGRAKSIGICHCSPPSLALSSSLFSLLLSPSFYVVSCLHHCFLVREVWQTELIPGFGCRKKWRDKQQSVLGELCRHYSLFGQGRVFQ